MDAYLKSSTNPIIFIKNNVFIGFLIIGAAAKYSPKPKGQRPFRLREIFLQYYIQIYSFFSCQSGNFMLYLSI